MLGHPLVAVACAIWLIVDAAELRKFRYESTVGRVVWVMVGRDRSNPGSMLNVLGRRVGDSFELPVRDGASADEMSAVWSDPNGVIIALHQENIARGFWAPMSKVRRTFFEVTPTAWGIQQPLELSAVQMQNLRQEMVVWLDANSYPPEVGELALAAPSQTREYLWANIARNTVATAVLVLMVLSLANSRVWWRVKRAERRAKLFARGVCPECGYRMEDAARCPECGGERD